MEDINSIFQYFVKNIQISLSNNVDLLSPLNYIEFAFFLKNIKLCLRKLLGQ